MRVAGHPLVSMLAGALALAAVSGCAGLRPWAATRPLMAPTQISGKPGKIERGRVLEMKVFVTPAAHARLLAHFQRESQVVKTTPMVSYYFDAYDRTQGQFVLQNRPDGGAKFRFRVKPREGAPPKVSIQAKSRFQPTRFPEVAGLPFSVRYTEALGQDLDPAATIALAARAEEANALFSDAASPTSFAAGARAAGEAFLAAPSAMVPAFETALSDAGGKRTDVVFGGALSNLRHDVAPRTTPDGVPYAFELDAYRLAIAPGQFVDEHAVEADIEPHADPAETERQVQAVLADVARLLAGLGVLPADTLAPREALSDPLGPNGGYMGPVAALLKLARRV